MRRFLRARYATTLPRFDLMAALERASGRPDHGRAVAPADGVGRQRDLDRGAGLERDGLVRRRSPASDRRTSYVALTEQGRKSFEAMAGEHERWINELLANVSDKDADALTDLLAELKHEAEAGAQAGRAP